MISRDNKGVLFLTKGRLTSVEKRAELGNHHFAPIRVKIGSSNSHGWLRNPEGQFDKE